MIDEIFGREIVSEIAKTPAPPYYAVIFTSYRTEGDHGYNETAERMIELASQQPGFLGVESARERGHYRVILVKSGVY